MWICVGSAAACCVLVLYFLPTCRTGSRSLLENILQFVPKVLLRTLAQSSLRRHEEFDFDTFKGKCTLSLLRDADFAHPGGETAVDLMLKTCTRKCTPASIVDVGCGLGGTAALVKEKYYRDSTVVGIDIDDAAIEYAKLKYSEVQFETCDIMHITASKKVILDKIDTPGFHLAYMITCFYAIPDQQQGLRSLADVCIPGATLLLLDYSDPRGVWPRNTDKLPDRTHFFSPINPQTIASELDAAGWCLDWQMDVTLHFKRWYHSMNDEIKNKQSKLSTEHYKCLVHKYGRQMPFALSTNLIGGILLQAHKKC
ncbi:Demethylrebeccamycin-D-glucose O-methyltransferase [Pelomyxa schiedti]|nr:Demethylrebeccamycin-D-glucose O-methyltransferase [Pelomyxa schiedti]